MLKSELDQQVDRLANRWTVRKETVDALKADLWLQFKDYHYNHLAGAVQYWIDNNDKFPAYSSLKKLIEKQKEFNEEKNSKETGLGYTLDKHCGSGLCTAIINHPDYTQSICTCNAITAYFCKEHEELAVMENKRKGAHLKDDLDLFNFKIRVLSGNERIKPKPEKDKPVQRTEIINEEDLPF